MQYLNMRKAIGLILALAFFVGGTQTALAVGTASGVTISNTATVDYDVAGDNRSASSLAVDFVVDNRVDLTVANQDGNNVNVTPSATDQVQTYTVTNTGNTAQGYLLSTAIPTANIPMGNVRIYVDDPDSGTIGSWDASDPQYIVGTTGNFANLFPGGEFAVGATTTAGLDHDNGVGGRLSVTVFVVADTPAAAADGTTDDVRLVAQTTDVGTDTVTDDTALPTAGGVEVVFADGAGTTSDAANDGQHSDAATYTVVSAALTAAKVIANVNDEFNGDGGYAIPGAVVRYQITITNGGTGAVDADTVVVSDPIPANTMVCVAAGTRCTAADLATFTSGTSGLAASFEYSTDGGGTWGAAPAADDPTGANTTVTDIRLVTTGSMVSTGAFDITFGVVVE